MKVWTLKSNHRTITAGPEETEEENFTAHHHHHHHRRALLSAGRTARARTKMSARTDQPLSAQRQQKHSFEAGDEKLTLEKTPN